MNKETYRLTAHKIIRQNGNCKNIKCSDCPLDVKCPANYPIVIKSKIEEWLLNNN